MKLKYLRFVALVTAGLLIPAPVLADSWTVNPEKSTLGFEVQQGTGILKGTFGAWTASIIFDPTEPETAKISASIQPATATTGNPQFDGTLPNADWFHVSAFPAATFTAENVSLVEGTSYRAEGTLEIKGISQPVSLDFTLEIEGDTARAKGTATLQRLAYQLGTGVGTDTVGDAVTVRLDLTAKR